MMSNPDAPPTVGEDGQIAIGGASFPAAAPTGYKSSRAGVGVYVLEAVVLLLRAKKASDYVRACLAKKIKGVVTTDQSDLRSYVTGASEDSKQLEDDAEAPAAPAAPAESPAAEDLKNRDPDDGCKSFGDRNHALVCIPGRDFTFAAQLYDRYLKREKEDRARAEREKRKEKEKAAKGGDKRPRDGGATDSGADPKRKKTSEKTASVGIIIVPNAPTALLTLLNAGDLLERDRFATPAEKRKQGARKEPIVKVRRTKPDGEIQQFKLVDDPRRLSDSDWKRVVAVVAQGAAWQFKGWKVSRPVDLFHRYLGVHFKYDDVDTAPEVKKWNVSVISINKHKRHLDATAAGGFWRLVDDFLAKQKMQKDAAKKSGASSSRKK